MGGFEVLDTAVKIGLGALISGVTAVITLKLNQKHEISKENEQHKRQLAASKKILYIDFLTASHVLIQKYRDTQCMADTEDYFAYIRLYNELQIIANEPLKICAFHLMNAVNKSIVFRKTNMDADDMDSLRIMRKEVHDRIGEFQYNVKEELSI